MASGHAGPHAARRWEKAGTSLSEVLAALPQLRREAEGHEAGTRTAVMTVIMVTTSDDDAEDCASSVRSLGVHHPCRLLLLRPEPERTPSRPRAPPTRCSSRRCACA
jgi:hypothetical protein